MWAVSPLIIIIRSKETKVQVLLQYCLFLLSVEAAVVVPPRIQPVWHTTTVVSSTTNIGQSLNVGKCGLSMEDWESVLFGSPNQDQSILRLIMSDIDDPSVGLNKIHQPPSDGGDGGRSENLEFNVGFGMVDHGFELDSITSSVSLINNIDPLISCFDFFVTSNPSSLLPLLLSGVFPQQQSQLQVVDEKPQIFNPHMIINQNQAQFTQNPTMFLPLSYAQLQEHSLLSLSLPKRFNSGGPFSGSGLKLYLRCQQHQLIQMLQQRPITGKPKISTDDLENQQLQQAIIDQLIQAAELIETDDPILAQGILARLNH